MKDPIINTQLNVYGRLRQRLLDEYPNLDDETIRDTLEGITNVHEMIAAVIRSALVDEALESGFAHGLTRCGSGLQGLSGARPEETSAPRSRP